MPSHDLQTARIVAGSLALLSREIKEVGHPVDLWSPELSQEFIRDAAAKVGRGEARAIWVDERHPARGLAIYARSLWESELLGFGCARLQGPFMVVEDQLDRENRVRRLAMLAIEQGQADGTSMITVKTFHDPAILRGFLAENFVLAEIGASLAGVIPDGPCPEDPPPGFVFPEPEALPELAGEAVKDLGDFFYDGHYRHDSKPGPRAAQEFWRRAAIADLTGQADPALILWDRKKDRAAAIATAKISGREAVLSVLAVGQAYQTQGFGRLIMHKLLNSLRGRVCRLKIETASYNLPALNLYQSLGLHHVAPLAALHYHF